MKVEQVYEIVNTMTQEFIGDSIVVKEDLSNVVDIGNAVIGLDNLDKYIGSLIDQIAVIRFVDRPYSSKVPSLYVEAWEYGAIMEKITMDELPEAEINDTWNLSNGRSYDPNIFTAPKASAKFFSKKDTYDIPMSFAKRQVEMAFRSPQELNAFFSMIETWIQTSMTVKIDKLAMASLNNMIALAIDNANTNQAINLLPLYNATVTTPIQAADAIYNPGFLRYASYIMGLYADRIQVLSKLFNIGEKERFTPKDRLHMILLSEFTRAAEAYLQSDTYHEQFVKLPAGDTVPFWQGSGTDYGFSSTSKIHVQANDGTAGGKEVEATGILGVMFDRWAVGVANLDRRVTTQWNGRAEFYNNWYKFDAGYFNDPNENFVVFYVADSN